MKNKKLKFLVKKLLNKSTKDDVVDFNTLKKVSDEVFKRNDYVYKVLSEC